MMMSLQQILTATHTIVTSDVTTISTVYLPYRHYWFQFILQPSFLQLLQFGSSHPKQNCGAGFNNNDVLPVTTPTVLKHQWKEQ